MTIKFWLALVASLIFGLGVTVKAAGLPALTITSPMVDEKITGTSVPVQLAVTNFNLVDYKLHPKNSRGQGHIHLWLDQAVNDPMSAIKIFNNSYVFDNVKPGMHTLVAELVNDDHAPLVPPVRTTVTFTTADTAAVSNSNFVSPFLVAILAFLFLMIVLFFVNSQAKSGSKSGTPTRKYSPKSSKRSH